MTEEQTVNFKQRIIGAIVLVSLGVILIPFLLNGGPELKQVISGSHIPKMPNNLMQQLPAIPKPDIMPEPRTVIAQPVVNNKQDIKAKQLPDSKNQLSNKAPSKKKQAPVHDDPNIKNSSKDKTVDDKFGSAVNNQYEKASKPASPEIKMAYTLQVASFSKKSNAFTFQNKLRKAEFKAYIESIMTAKGKIYRLRVGPYLKYEQISSDKKKIEKRFKVSDTVIVKYET